MHHQLVNEPFNASQKNKPKHMRQRIAVGINIISMFFCHLSLNVGTLACQNNHQ